MNVLANSANVGTSFGFAGGGFRIASSSRLMCSRSALSAASFVSMLGVPSIRSAIRPEGGSSCGIASGRPTSCLGTRSLDWSSFPAANRLARHECTIQKCHDGRLPDPDHPPRAHACVAPTVRQASANASYGGRVRVPRVPSQMGARVPDAFKHPCRCPSPTAPSAKKGPTDAIGQVQLAQPMGPSPTARSHPPPTRDPTTKFPLDRSPVVADESGSPSASGPSGELVNHPLPVGGGPSTSCLLASELDGAASKVLGAGAASPPASRFLQTPEGV